MPDNDSHAQDPEPYTPGPGNVEPGAPAGPPPIAPPPPQQPPPPGMGPPQPGYYGPPGMDPNGLTSDERMWAMFAHLSPLLLGILGPLIIWLVKRYESPFVEVEAKEALNFQLTALIISLVLAITCVGIVVLFPYAIAVLVYEIMAGIEANKGVHYRYPDFMCWRMIH